MHFKTIKKILRKFYFQNILGFRHHTVILRHKISDEQEKFLQNHHLFLTLNKIKSFQENNSVPLYLEIGFGSGEHLVELGKINRENKNLKILGVELYKPGVVKTLKKIDVEELENVFVNSDDVRDVLQILKKESLQKTFILFPDPWTKKRQFKKRLVNKEFLIKVLEKIGVGGETIISTDWEHYAESVENILEELKKEGKINFEKYGESLEFKNILETTFAKRAKREGRSINIFKVLKL